MSEEKKTVIVSFTNPEGKMKLKVRGINAVDQAARIMKTFDNACEEIRKEDKSSKEVS